MNFEFVKECRMESPELQGMYEAISAQLEQAERCYWKAPQECGIILRSVAEKICLVYNSYYQIGCPADTSLEGFLCYTDNDGHNAMVSRFLSVVRKEQRDRLNKLRVLGDDCILGENAPDQGMTFEDRMSQNAKRMMDTMMEVLRDMCGKINKRQDVQNKFFQEAALPEPKERTEEGEKEAREQEKKEKKSWFDNIHRFIDRKDK